MSVVEEIPLSVSLKVWAGWYWPVFGLQSLRPLDTEPGQHLPRREEETLAGAPTVEVRAAISAVSVWYPIGRAVGGGTDVPE